MANTSCGIPNLLLVKKKRYIQPENKRGRQNGQDQKH